MRALSSPIYGVRHVRNVHIPMRDGAWLAADLFLPDGPGADGPFPAILEYLPYRKDDLSAARRDTHHYFAQRGYVGVRLDVRGTGASAGVARDEYTQTEQLDGYDAIEWIAAQPWCTGKVGMWGTSYGGFNCIQVAMHAPPHLAAIAPHAATDDRYRDDVHYTGGCMMALDLVIYPVWMVAMNALPPHPEVSGSDWEGIWHEHLDNPHWLLEWMRHQTEDAYWLHGSLKTDYAAIRCPVFHIGGWADGYTNAVFRMAERLRVPYRALVGPWTHMRPNVGYCGPHINFLHELLRWWDHWLKGNDTGLMDEPPLALYIQESRAPARFPAAVPGHWRYEMAWPPPTQAIEPWYLCPDGGLSREAPTIAGILRYDYDATVGTEAGFWCPGAVLGLAADQRGDDARSVTFISAPLDEPLELLGVPEAILTVQSSAPVAFFAVKLCDIAPNGASTLISRGILNATRRDSFADPAPLVPGETYPLTVPLKVVSWALPVGHRVRVSVSSADWPTVWPSPYPATNTLHLGGDAPAQIRLPVRRHESASLPTPRFLPPAPLPVTADVTGGASAWETARGEATGRMTTRLASSGAKAPTGSDIGTISEEFRAAASASPDDPAAVQVWGEQCYTLHRADGVTVVSGTAVITSDQDNFAVVVTLDVARDGVSVANRRWQESIPRRLL